MAAQTRIKLRITASVPLGGRKPGETFSLPADAVGVPLDLFWRNRLDESARATAAGRTPSVVVVIRAAPEVTAPEDGEVTAEPVSDPAPAKRRPKS